MGYKKPRPEGQGVSPTLPLTAQPELPEDIRPLAEGGEDEGGEEGEGEEVKHHFGGGLYEGFSNHNIYYNAQGGQKLKHKNKNLSKTQS